MKVNNETILICSNYAWTVYNFRMPLVRRLKQEGYRVAVLTQFDGYEKLIEKEADEVRHLFVSRKGVNPIIDALTVFDFIRHFYSIKPILIFSFTIKPVIYGGIAARFTGSRHVVTITGLGTAFIKNTWITKVVKALYKFSLVSVTTAFFQNADDKDLFVNSGLIDEQMCRLVPGSGIDVDKFSIAELPDNDGLTFLFIGRVLWDKGVGEYVQAAKHLKAVYPNARFQLLGPLGVENRTSISSGQMEKWVKDDGIEYLGETDNVAEYIERACCVVLPSYREGTSRVLLEAASMGRPLIATDVPGCREVIEDKVTGFLCRPRDFHDLADKMEIMLKLSIECRREMGSKGRDKIVREFDQGIVCDLYADSIEQNVLGGAGG